MTRRSERRPPLKLYQLPFSHHAAKVRLVLLEKGIDHELAGLPGSVTGSPEFLAMDPLGRVPFLVDGATRLGESEVIVEYLEDIAPEPAMLPRRAEARARSRWLTRVHDLYLGPQLTTLFLALGERRHRDAEVMSAVDELERITGIVEDAIDPSPFFFGGSFGIADAAYALSVHYLLLLARVYERPFPERRAPKLMRWFDAARSRPSVAQVISDCEAALMLR